MAANELEIPPSAAARPQTFEVLRLWVDPEQHHVNVKPEVWEDPLAWGLTLAYVATAVGDAYRQYGGRDPAETVERIREGFEEGLKHLPR
jgi:hypothetical protein